MVAAPTNGAGRSSRGRDPLGRPALVEEFPVRPEDEGRLRDLAERLRGLSHPCLARFYSLEVADGQARACTEWVEAVEGRGSLKALSHLAQGLDRLREASGGQLPMELESSVVAVSGGGFRLARYHLGRWLAEPAESRARRLARAFQELARLALQLLKGRRPLDARGIYACELPFRMAWVFERALSGDPGRCFRSFGEFTAMLDQESTPVPLRAHRSLPPVRRTRPTPPSWSSWAWRAVVAGVLVLAGAGLTRMLATQPLVLPQQPLVMVAQGRRLSLHETRHGQQVGSLELEQPIAGLAVSRNILYVSLPAGQRVARLDLVSGEWLSDLPVGPGAQAIGLGPGGSWLAVEYPSARLVSLWQLTSKARPKGSLGVKSASLGCWFVLGQLAVGCPDCELTFYALNPLKVVGSLQGGARALAVSPGGRYLFVAGGGSGVRVVEASTLQTVGNLAAGPGPIRDLTVASATGHLWLLHEDGLLLELDPHGGERVSSREIPGRPGLATLDAARRIWWSATSEPPTLTAFSLSAGRVLERVALEQAAQALVVWPGPREEK